MRNFLLILFLFCSFSALAQRNEISRFKQMHDRMRNEEIYRLLPHKFFFDTTVRESLKVRQLIDEGEDASRAGQAAVTRFLRENMNTEHYGQISARVGVRLPRFRIKGNEFELDLRSNFDIGASASITQLPNPITINGVLVSANDPFIQLFIKQDIKTGARLGANDIKDFFFDWFVYELSRWDIYEAVTATQIISNGKVIRLNRNRNTAHTVNSDLKVGYDYGDSQFFAAIEEVQLRRITDKTATDGQNYYGRNPMLRFHGNRLFTFSWFDLNTFLGVHKRKGYVWGKGIYGGVEANPDSWPLSMLTVIDNEYVTLNPRLRFKYFHFEYSLRLPFMNETDGGAKTRTIHAINLRVQI